MESVFKWSPDNWQFCPSRWGEQAGAPPRSQHHAVTVTHLARRELREESGLTVDTLHKVGQIMFEFVGEPELMDVHIFCTDSVQGTPVESDGESGGLCFPPQWPGPGGRHCAST